MILLLPALLLGPTIPPAPAELDFERRQLSGQFFSEGAAAGDLNRDGHGDVVSGPYWYEGPDFERRHELYAPKAFDPLGYSDNFFAWVRDLDADGWPDVLTVGFPGRDAAWFRNPAGEERHWERHVVFQGVDDESPAYTDLTGDGAPELVLLHGGRFGWAGPDANDPRRPWRFHALSPPLGLGVFTHGLGVGDVNGDGRADLLEREGWWEQPASLAGDPTWLRHEFPFAVGRRGGAQMFALDIDGDGDADVLTSLDAHGWGLSWFEQVEDGGERSFVEHRILDERPAGELEGITFSQIHALDLCDFDGDGLLDLLAGKRHWAHGPKGDPEPNAPAVVYVLLLRRDAQGARFAPVLVDDDSGVGTQVSAADVDGDGRPDVVVGNKKGSFVFLQRDESVGAAPAAPAATEGAPDLGFESGTLAGWTATGEAFEGQPVRGDTVTPRGKAEGSRHAGEFWIGGHELHGDDPTGTLTSRPFAVTQPWASFLVSGGHHESTRVELVRQRDGQVLAKVSGPDREALQRYVVDLSAEMGELVAVRLVDEHSGHWGHVNFDDFRFHATRPELEQDPGLPNTRAYGEVPYSGLSPEEAARAMSVPQGFAVDLVAGEPELHQPIALAIDHRGRIWVAEAHSYPQRRPQGEGLDRIVVFEDADADGRFERCVEFARGLNLVSGLAVGFGGVWVGAAPNLAFIPDRDGDLVPDGQPEVLLDGWGYQDTHETLNSFTWGPDGWLYGCHGVFTHSRVGAPGTPDEQRVPLNAGVWRFHPTRHEFEVFAWGTSNPWGIDFDERGQAFLTACVIPHLWHVVQGARYERQSGEHFGAHVYDVLRTIADHKHYAGDIGDHAWWGRDEPVHYRDTQAAGGGHAHCGCTIYLGEQFPDEYRGTLFVGNVHGNRFNNERLEPLGSGFVGRHGPDFLLANDEWFRAVDLKVGPDGSAYVIDWYDERACHRTDLAGWDRTNGRLYRVRYGDLRPAAVLAGGLRGPELVAALLDRNEWRSRHARQVLQERRVELADHAGLLEHVLRMEAGLERRLRAMWGLHALERFDERLARELLDDPEESLRSWAIQLALEDRQASAPLRERMVELAREDPSPVVRLYLAAALQRLPLAERWAIAEGLATHAGDDADPNLPLMLWYGVEPLVREDPARALVLARDSAIGSLRRFVPRRAAYEEDCHQALVEALAAAGEGDWLRTMLAETVRAFGEKRLERMPGGWPAVHARLSASEDAEVRDLAFSIGVAFGDASVFPELRLLLADSQVELHRRERALEDLLRGRDVEVVPVLIALLDEDLLRGRAIRALASFEDPAIPPALLDRYPSLSEVERRDARNVLAARRSSARALIAEVEAGRLAAGELDQVTLRQLVTHGDPELQRCIEGVWGMARPTAEEKRAEIERWKAALGPEALAAADLPRGREVFARTCQQCHTLFGTGGDVGPDITGSNRADLDYLLETVVDPNALIPKEYQVTAVRLIDGLLVSGVLKRETEDALTLQNQTETVVVWKDEIEERVPQEVSMMPEGQLAALAEDEVRDLVAYLVSPGQVPLRATPDNADRFFDGETLAGWTGDPRCWSVEQGEIVGRSAGLAQNEFLKSELELGDFRLIVEVRLAGNEGNSGIQLRSRALEGGDVAGYQADIGAGWWGQLYEEHGRGLLWDRPADERVEPDGWNTYEVLAVGHRVRTALNGRPCVDLEDPDGALRGIVALQIHSGGPTEVRFRGLRLELDPEPELVTVHRD